MLVLTWEELLALCDDPSVHADLAHQLALGAHRYQLRDGGFLRL